MCCVRLSCSQRFQQHGQGPDLKDFLGGFRMLTMARRGRFRMEKGWTYGDIFMNRSIASVTCFMCKLWLQICEDIESNISNVSFKFFSLFGITILPHYCVVASSFPLVWGSKDLHVFSCVLPGPFVPCVWAEWTACFQPEWPFQRRKSMEMMPPH